MRNERIIPNQANQFHGFCVGKKILQWWSHANSVKVWWRNPRQNNENLQFLCYPKRNSGIVFGYLIHCDFVMVIRRCWYYFTLQIINFATIFSKGDSLKCWASYLFLLRSMRTFGSFSDLLDRRFPIHHCLKYWNQKI